MVKTKDYNYTRDHTVDQSFELRIIIIIIITCHHFMMGWWLAQGNLFNERYNLRKRELLLHSAKAKLSEFALRLNTSKEPNTFILPNHCFLCNDWWQKKQMQLNDCNCKESYTKKRQKQPLIDSQQHWFRILNVALESF